MLIPLRSAVMMSSHLGVIYKDLERTVPTQVVAIFLEWG